MAAIQKINAKLLDDLIAKAHQSPRLRTIHCFHDGDWEHCHRMLNALAVGTYVRPHRHGDKFQSEGFILLRGKIAVLIFDENGEVDQENSCLLNTQNGDVGMNIKPGIWHSLVALEDAVIYEVKGHPNGGYVAERDKDFAAWAPAEADPLADEYLKKLTDAVTNLL